MTAEIIKNGRIEGCKSQENGLALLWTLGIFALNIGPVPMGFVLDAIGPCFTSILGAPCARRCSDGVGFQESRVALVKTTEFISSQVASLS